MNLQELLALLSGGARATEDPRIAAMQKMRQAQPLGRSPAPDPLANMDPGLSPVPPGTDPLAHQMIQDDPMFGLENMISGGDDIDSFGHDMLTRSAHPAMVGGLNSVRLKRHFREGEPTPQQRIDEGFEEVGRYPLREFDGFENQLPPGSMRGRTSENYLDQMQNQMGANHNDPDEIGMPPPDAPRAMWQRYYERLDRQERERDAIRGPQTEDRSRLTDEEREQIGRQFNSDDPFPEPPELTEDELEQDDMMGRHFSIQRGVGRSGIIRRR